MKAQESDGTRSYFASILQSLWWPCAQSLSAASRMISTAAIHFGALGAGSPSGVSLSEQNQFSERAAKQVRIPVNL
jgi:hypothetical protein